MKLSQWTKWAIKTVMMDKMGDKTVTMDKMGNKTVTMGRMGNKIVTMNKKWAVRLSQWTGKWAKGSDDVTRAIGQRAVIMSQ